MQDHNAGIIEFAGGAGLIPSPNPPLGAPNAGLSQAMDNMAFYMTSLVPRRGSPFRNPDGTQTAEADSGEVIFNDPTVGCATCHVPPFYTDSSLLSNPFVKHDVGTADPGDLDAAAGFDTPSLVNIWDSGPYLHHALASTIGQNAAQSLLKIFSDFNPNDLHGVTSGLSAHEKDLLVAFLLQITWPDSTGPGPVDVPEVSTAVSRNSFDSVFPNPFREETSLQFSVANGPSAVRVDVFDVTGRRVRTILDRVMTRGSHVVGWDGRDEGRSAVAPGVYFAKLTIDGVELKSKRLNIVR
jgi:hypothetical protein